MVVSAITPRFLVAKYIPDLQRMEPRNIGVVVWSPVGTAARFLAERSDRPGTVDGRSVPGFVTSQQAYRQWIQFWRSELDRPAIEPAEDGAHVPQGSPNFVEALRATSGGNFVLVDGGFLLDPVAGDELLQLVEHLYAILVQTSIGDEARDQDLDAICDRLIYETRLNWDSHFYTRYRVEYQIAPGVREEFTFSHAYANGVVQRLYQRVPLSKRPTTLRKNVHDAAWMFEKVIENETIQPDQGAALVYATPEEQEDREVGRALRTLASVTRVLNVYEEQPVRSEFQALVSR